MPTGKAQRISPLDGRSNPSKSNDGAVLLPSRQRSERSLALPAMSRKLFHYLRSERRRSALTQADIAALLGGPWKGRVSWYERGAMPPTQVALAYEVILGKAVAELFGGAYDDALFRVRSRARDLLAKEDPANTARRLRRRKTLERIAA